jgi:hypothetical protein
LELSTRTDPHHPPVVERHSHARLPLEEENKNQPAQEGLSVNEWSSVTGTARRGAAGNHAAVWKEILECPPDHGRNGMMIGGRKVN